MPILRINAQTNKLGSRSHRDVFLDPEDLEYLSEDQKNQLMDELINDHQSLIVDVWGEWIEEND